MKRWVTLLVALLLASCVPEERIWWSPAGDRALVLMEDQLHLIGADGRMRAKLDEPSLKDVPVKSVTWLPDGSGFICVRVRSAHSWDDAARAIPADEAAQVDRFMPLVMPLLEVAAKRTPSAQEWAQLATTMPPSTRAALLAATLRTYAADPAKMESALSSLTDAKALLDSLREDGAAFDINEVCRVLLEGDRVAKVEVLRSSMLKHYALPKVSPQGEHMALVCFGEQDDHANLEVHSLRADAGANAALTLTARATPAFDWMPDGRSLVFLSSVDGQSQTLCALNRATLVTDDGKLMTNNELNAGKHMQVLASALVTTPPALRVLPDGRTLLAAQPVTLPFLGGELTEAPKLYLLAADGLTLSPMPTAPGALPTDLSHFTLSPDGRRVAIVEGGTDAVALVELDSGKTDLIAPATEGWKCRTLPAWRTAEELVFAGVQEQKAVLMRWKDGAGVERFADGWDTHAQAKWSEAPEKSTP